MHSIARLRNISEPAPADTLRLAIRHSPGTLHSSTNRVTCPHNHTLTKANATSSTDATNDPNARHKTKNADAGTGTVRQCSSAIDLYHVFSLQASLGCQSHVCCQNHSRVVHRLENTGKDNSDKSFKFPRLRWNHENNEVTQLHVVSRGARCPR